MSRPVKPIYTEVARSCAMCGAVTEVRHLRGRRHYQVCRTCWEQMQERQAREELAWLDDLVPPERAR